MPRLVHPVQALPAPVSEAFELVRSETRAVLVNWLDQHPNSMVTEIVAGIGGERHVTRRHLTALENIGVVVASHPSGTRHGNRVTYRIDAAKHQEMLSRLMDFLSLPSSE